MLLCSSCFFSGASGWTACEDFQLPHRARILRTSATSTADFAKLAPLSADVLLVSDNVVNPTWDSMSTSTLFNYTLAYRHTIVESGCQNANSVLSVPPNTKLPQEVFIVSQGQFDRNELSIPVAQQSLVGDIRMIARPFAHRGADDTASKSFFITIIRPKLIDLFERLKASTQLQEVVLAGFNKTFGGLFVFCFLNEAVS